MLKTNIIGSLFIVLIIFSLVAVGMMLRISIDWSGYFKLLGIVGMIAVVVSIIVHSIPSKE